MLGTDSEPIILLAWARQLGLADDALLAPGTVRVPRPDAGAVSFVELFGRRVLTGPPALIEELADRDASTLAEVGTLLSHAGRGARALGRASLSYTDAYRPGDTPEQVYRADAEAIQELSTACAPDDLAESGLADLSERFVLVDERERVVAAAGYQVWGGIIAHLGVVTAREHRRRGFGTTVAAAAVNQALDDGLIAQWRVSQGNAASLRLSIALGFVEAGTQTTVLLGGSMPGDAIR